MLSLVGFTVKNWRLAAAGFAVLALLLSHVYAYNGGKEAARVAMLANTLKQIEERGLINEQVNRADIRDICLELGGLPDDCPE